MGITYRDEEKLPQAPSASIAGPLRKTIADAFDQFVEPDDFDDKVLYAAALGETLRKTLERDEAKAKHVLKGLEAVREGTLPFFVIDGMPMEGHMSIRGHDPDYAPGTKPDVDFSPGTNRKIVDVNRYVDEGYFRRDRLRQSIMAVMHLYGSGLHLDIDDGVEGGTCFAMPKGAARQNSIITGSFGVEEDGWVKEDTVHYDNADFSILAYKQVDHDDHLRFYGTGREEFRSRIKVGAPPMHDEAIAIVKPQPGTVVVIGDGQVHSRDAHISKTAVPRESSKGKELEPSSRGRIMYRYFTRHEPLPDPAKVAEYEKQVLSASMER